MKCIQCGKEFEEKHFRANLCSKECDREYQRASRVRKSIKEYKDKPHCECKICGFMGMNLLPHITIQHKMTPKDYYEKYKCDISSVMLDEVRQKNAENQRRINLTTNRGFKKGAINPSLSSEAKLGINSPFSMNFRGYDGLSDEEKVKKIADLKHSMAQKKKENKTNPLSIDYWTNLGYTEDEAKEKLKERQSTFNLKKCIEKYGEEEGRKRWAERQEKWQENILSKPDDEIERIARAKMNNGRGYSKISQKLFWAIYDRIKDDYKDIYFAELKKTNMYENGEYFVKLGKKMFFLDFYIKDLNKVIEFDGDYWHSDKRGNQERDRKRNEALEKGGFEIYHVLERAYKENEEKIIQECIGWLKSA